MFKLKVIIKPKCTHDNFVIYNNNNTDTNNNNRMHWTLTLGLLLELLTRSFMTFIRRLSKDIQLINHFYVTGHKSYRIPQNDAT